MTDATIVRITGRRVWDSRGRPTVEAEVDLQGGAKGRAIAPSGASRGSREAVDLRDGGEALGGLGVGQAVNNVNDPIASRLGGMDARNQGEIDRALIDLDGTGTMASLGGNATVAVSLAVLHAAAAAAGQPLWRHLAEACGTKEVRLPMPEVQIFGGGAHAARRVDIQDFMVVPIAAATFDEALVMTSEVYTAAGRLQADRGALAGVADEGGWWPTFDSNEDGLALLTQAIESAGYRPGEDIAIALDIAASEFGARGRYTLALESRTLDSDALGDLLRGWLCRYPIVSMEDPLAEDDDAALQRFTEAVGERVQIVGDDAVCTNAERIRALAELGACNTALIKPNQIGTVTGTKAAIDAARDVGWGAILSARSGETEDVSIVHLACGWGVGQLKVGSFARSERMAKWNEGIRVEGALNPPLFAGTVEFGGRIGS